MAKEDNEATLVSTFYIRESFFGLYTSEVQEIVPCGKITRVHHAPDYIHGIINLRGQIYTVVDLAVRLGIPSDVNRQDGYILIVTWEGENVGLLVERVSDVIPVDVADLRPLPANVNEVQREFIRGVYQTSLHPVAILDVQAVLAEGGERERI